jgi:hypothetical protein
MPARYKYCQFKAGAVTLMMTAQRAARFSRLLWLEPVFKPHAWDLLVPIPASLKSNLLEMTLQQTTQTYRPRLVERWTRILKFLSDEWNVEPIPDGEISSLGMYKVSFDTEIAALDTFNIVLPTIAVEGTA